MGYLLTYGMQFTLIPIILVYPFIKFFILKPWFTRMLIS